VDSTRLSSKGQIIIPKALREARGWQAGTVFEIEAVGDAVLLRPVPAFAITTLDDVVGCLGWDGSAKSLADMDAAVAQEARRRARS
jgi:AbrB family looped-hinge helix DNA binding protein